MARTIKKNHGNEEGKTESIKKEYKRVQLVQYMGRIMSHEEMLETKSNHYR